MMRWLMILVFILISGCQNKNYFDNQKDDHQTQHGQPGNSPVKKKVEIKKMPATENAIVSDGAPTGPIPVSFKEVKPVSEPLSRYGNPATYKVDGHTYEVMTTSSGYKARGLASWYGTKFHRKRTSSGENYDLYALTAAHKTLPLPTYVKVKNLNNGRVAIVKVNDRGPFHKDRIIDLSYGAAVKLGLLPKGTAPVEIEALSAEKVKKLPARYFIQAGAFASRDLATALRHKLSSLTPSPVFIEQYQKYFIVKVGPFANKQMSDKLRNILSSRGVSGTFSVLQ